MTCVLVMALCNQPEACASDLGDGSHITCIDICVCVSCVCRVPAYLIGRLSWQLCRKILISNDRHVMHSRRSCRERKSAAAVQFYYILLSFSNHTTTNQPNRVYVQRTYHPNPLTSNRHHLSYDDCLENKGRLQDCLCSIGSYRCIQCYAHIL